MVATSHGKLVVWNTLDLKNALAAGYSPDNLVLPSENIENRIQSARQQGYNEGFAAGKSEKISVAAGSIDPQIRARICGEERVRISEIQALAEKGFDNVAGQAIAQGWSVEKFALEQVREMKDRGITLDQMRRDAPRAAGHMLLEDVDRVQAKASPKSADSIFERRKRESMGTVGSSK